MHLFEFRLEINEIDMGTSILFLSLFQNSVLKTILKYVCHGRKNLNLSGYNVGIIIDVMIWW